LINSVEDHVHIVFTLGRTRAISEIVEATKTGTSKWIKTKGPEFSNFHWQGGYGAFSVSQSGIGAVSATAKSKIAIASLSLDWTTIAKRSISAHGPFVVCPLKT
jgi:hypothetical protein